MTYGYTDPFVHEDRDEDLSALRARVAELEDFKREALAILAEINDLSNGVICRAEAGEASRTLDEDLQNATAVTLAGPVDATLAARPGAVTPNPDNLRARLREVLKYYRGVQSEHAADSQQARAFRDCFNDIEALLDSEAKETPDGQ